MPSSCTNAAELGVGVEDDVVVAVEVDALMLEPRPEAPEAIARFEDDGREPGLQKKVRAREPADPAAEHGDAFSRCIHHDLVSLRVAEHSDAGDSGPHVRCRLLDLSPNSCLSVRRLRSDTSVIPRGRAPF